MPLCGLYDGGDVCGVRGERRFMDGWRCPRHVLVETNDDDKGDQET